MKLEIKFLNSIRFTKLLIAASRWLSKYSDVLNDLNVYPMPDGDTGTNMSMTLQSVENELIKLDHKIDMEELVELVSDSVILGARGNSGIILSQFIQGFLKGIKGKEEVSIADVAKGFDLAREYAYGAVENPVEGTMLTVIKRVAEGALNYKGPKDDFILFLVHVKNIAQEAVEETPNILSNLKDAGVVDAGGKGIFYMLEGFEKSVTDPEMLKDLERIVKSQENRRERLENQRVERVCERARTDYSVEFLIACQEIDMDSYKDELSKYGDSIICVQAAKKIKTHIHTNNPGIILEIGLKHGALSHVVVKNIDVKHQNVEENDSSEKQEELEENSIAKYINEVSNGSRGSEIAIVTDSSSDLTKELIKDLDITIIPLKVKLNNEEYYRDGIDLDKTVFWKNITEKGVMPKTSHPSPGEFKKLYEELFEKGYKKIISIHLSSKLSGTQQSAKVAKEMLEKNEENVIVIDSNTVSIGLGYQTLCAANMVKNNLSIKDILAELEVIQSREKLYFVVSDINYLLKSGRIGKTKALIGDIFNLRTILKIQDGEICLESNHIGESGAQKALIKIIKNEMSKGEIDLSLSWGGTKKEKNSIYKIEKGLEGLSEIIVIQKCEIGGTIGSHTGPVYCVGIISKK